MPKSGTFGSVRGVSGNGHSYRDQFFSGQTYYEPKLPCDATQLGRFRRLLGEPGVELLLKTTIETAAALKAIKPQDVERVIVDTTVQEKAIAFPSDSRLLEGARAKIAVLARRAGIAPKQTYEREGRTLARRAGGYAHARQTKRLGRVLKRQRVILGRLLRDVRRKTTAITEAAREALEPWLARTERLQRQQRHDKNKLYALHAPEVECIGKGKRRQPYEFGVKASVAVTARGGLIVGARTFPGNPYDGHTLAAQIEQTATLLEDLGTKPKIAIVDLGYRGVDHLVPVKVVHRGRYKTMDAKERRWLKRRQAVEPAIGHLKADCGMRRCWLKGAEGDAVHAVLCAAGFNLRWLMQAIAKMGLRALLLAFFGLWRLLAMVLMKPRSRQMPPGLGRMTAAEPFPAS